MSGPLLVDPRRSSSSLTKAEKGSPIGGEGSGGCQRREDGEERRRGLSPPRWSTEERGGKRGGGGGKLETVAASEEQDRREGKSLWLEEPYKEDRSQTRRRPGGRRQSCTARRRVGGGSAISCEHSPNVNEDVAPTLSPLHHHHPSSYAASSPPPPSLLHFLFTSVGSAVRRRLPRANPMFVAALLAFLAAGTVQAVAECMCEYKHNHFKQIKKDKFEEIVRDGGSLIEMK